MPRGFISAVTYRVGYHQSILSSYKHPKSIWHGNNAISHRFSEEIKIARNFGDDSGSFWGMFLDRFGAFWGPCATGMGQPFNYGEKL